MSMRIIHNTSLFLMLGITLCMAGMPVSTGSRGTASFGYAYSMDGSYITDAKVNSHLWVHQMEYAYAPCEFFELGIGLGLASFDVTLPNSYLFKGDRQFAPSAQVVLSTPAVIHELFRLRLQGNVLRFHSEDDQVTYSGLEYNGLGMFVFQAKCWHVELGGGIHWIDGTMENPRSESGFSNYYLGRGVLNIQHTSPRGVFLRLNLQGNANAEGWHSGPTETRVAFSIGYLLRPKAKAVRNDKLDPYFPAVPAMRTQQEKLEAEMQNSKQHEGSNSR